MKSHYFPSKYKTILYCEIKNGFPILNFNGIVVRIQWNILLQFYTFIWLSENKKLSFICFLNLIGNWQEQ